MVIKGVISVYDGAANKAEVILPELDDVVTPMIPVSMGIPTDHIKVGEKCVVAIFSDSFADGAVLAII
jgi:hypothetical protein